MTATLVSNANYNIVDIPIVQIFADDEFNCRGKLAPMDCMDLVTDIKDRGLDQPITVQPYSERPGKLYRIITGHRRFMAFRVLELATIPARIRTDLKPFDDYVMNLTENIKRKELNMLQEAYGLRAFKKARWGEAAIASRVNMSRGWVQVRLMLLDLPEDIQIEAAAGMLNQEQIRKLHTIRHDKNEMYAMVRLIKDRRLAGESAKVLFKKPANPYRKERREPEEMFQFQEIIQKVLGNNFATKCIGWCAGANNDYEIHRALQNEALRHGKSYEIPRELVERM